MPGLHEIESEVSIDGVRRKYLGELQQYTKRDTILYAAGSGTKPAALLPPETLMIVPDDMQGFMTSLQGLSGKQLDLILHSTGGRSEAAEQIVLYLRSKYDHIRVFVPQKAMSAATMIACAADEIVMGKESALGPIDPQIAIGQGPPIPAQAIIDDFEGAKAAVSADPKLAALFAPKFMTLPQGMLSYCQHAIERSRTLVEEWLQVYMHVSTSEAKRAAKWLSEHGEHRSHGRPINAERALAHGLKITMLEVDNTLQDKVLSVYHAMMVTFQRTECVKLVESHLKKGFYTRVQIQQIAPANHPMAVPAPRIVLPAPAQKPAAAPTPPSPQIVSLPSGPSPQSPAT